MAALLLKLEKLSEYKYRNDIIATMATISALLVTLSTTVDFQRKWRANRIAAAAMENLAYELLRPSAAEHREFILTRIQEINNARNAGIVGDAPETSSKVNRSASGAAQQGATEEPHQAPGRAVKHEH
jgi:hypothetical protein